MKETFYFSHDYNARNDSKIKKLIFKHGLLGYGIYWALIEDLYNNNNSLPMNYEMIAFDLRTESKIIESIIFEFDLFIIDTDQWIFWSASVYERLEQRNEKSLKAKQSAFKRWNKDASALQTNNESNTIKESKVKESKLKERKEKSNDIMALEIPILSPILSDLSCSKDNELSNPILEEKTSKTGLKQVKKGALNVKIAVLADSLPFKSSEFVELWNTLIKEKKWVNKSQAALKASLNKLKTYGESGAIQSMQDAISGNYQGVFPPKNFNNQNQISKPQQKINAFQEAQKILNNDNDNNNAD